jgi:WD40 repeat protein/serine/threonine protein kinase/tetratricopeptide (TPR) repeat protein
MRERDIFIEAIQKESATQRAQYLDTACGPDADLRRRVERLLLEHHRQETFMLDGEAPGLRRAGDLASHLANLIPAPGTVIGRYKLLEPIGEGGFGSVYMADQTSPVQRKVALKLVKAGMDSKQVIARFEAERQALALMDHPNIAKVFDAGVTETGRPYFVMELVKGVPITKYCDDHRLTPRQRLELFVQVCHGVQHAHQKGIIHRDLKPTNVLVALYDGAAVPKVIDFGVAKATGQRLTDRTMFTGFGDVIGTPQYMSPEQAELNQLDVDTRSDIYSLGVLLYELLTGTTPLEQRRAKDAALLEVLRLIREEEPPKPSTRLTTLDKLPTVAAQRGLEPRKLASAIKGELDWIVMKALEKDRSRRYDTANGLANDVRRYLNDEAVQACPPSVWYRFRKLARRNKASIAAAAAGLAVLVAAVVGLSVSNVLIGRERDSKQAALSSEHRAVGQAQKSAAEAAAHLVQARQSERSMRQALYASRIVIAQQAADAADVPRLRDLLNSLRPDVGQEDLRGFEWYHLWQICNNQRLKLQESSEVMAMAYSADGKTLLSAAGSQVTVWNTATGDKVGRFFAAAAGTIRALAFSPDGSVLAVGAGSPSGTGELTLWDSATRQKKRAISNLPEPVKSLAFTPDGNRIAVGLANVVSTGIVNESSHDHSIAPTVKPERLRLFDVESGSQVAQFTGQTSSILSVAFSADGKTVVSGTYDGRVIAWDANTGAQQTSERYGGPVSAVAISPDGRVLAVGCGTWEQIAPVVLHEFPSMKPIRSLPGHKAGVSSLAFLPDGRRLVSGSYDRTAIVWDVATGWRINHYKGPSHFVLSVAASPDGHSVATGTRDSLVFTWDVTSGCNDLKPIPPGGLAFAFLPDGRFLMDAKLLTLYDRRAATTRPIERVEGHDVLLATSPEGSWFAAINGAGDLTIFDAHTLTRRHYFKRPADDTAYKLYPISFAPDGKLIAAGGTDDKIVIRETESGRVVNELRPEGRRLRCMSFAPVGRTLATATSEGLSKTQIWDLSSGKPVATLDPGAFSLAYSADGSLLATAGATTISLYDTHSFRLVRSFRGHNEDIWGIAFSPDGRTLATAGYDRTVRLWCVSNGELLLAYPLEAAVWTVAFSPDGRTVAAKTGAGAHFFDSADPKAADEGLDGIHHRWHSLFAAGKADEAEHELRSSIDRYTQGEGADSVIAAHLTAELAGVLVARRDPTRYAQAETLLASARAVLIRNLPNGHTWRYGASMTARELYGPEAMNDVAKLAQIEGSIAARATTAPTMPESGKWTIRDLDPINVEAWKLRRDGKIEESAALRQRVVAEAKRLLAPDDIRLFKYLLGYGDVLTVLQRFEEAEAQYRQASTILGQQSAPAAPDKALLEANLRRLQKARSGGAAATLPTTATTTAITTAPTTTRTAPTPATELLAWDRLSPQGVSRAVQAALAADLANPGLSPFDRLIYGEHLILGGEPARAAGALRQALDEASKAGAAPSYYYKSLGWALLACGESEQATTALSRALGDERRWTGASPPADADSDAWTAAYLLSRVTQQHYIAHFSQTPNASFPLFYVGQLMEIQGKREAAVAAYQKATDSGTHHTRHWAAYRLQNLK